MSLWDRMMQVEKNLVSSGLFTVQSFSFQSSVCDKIMSQLGQDDVDRKQRRVAIINQDSFYKTLNEEEKKKALKGEFNFDHPGN